MSAGTWQIYVTSTKGEDAPYDIVSYSTSDEVIGYVQQPGTMDAQCVTYHGVTFWDRNEGIPALLAKVAKLGSK